MHKYRTGNQRPNWMLHQNFLFKEWRFIKKYKVRLFFSSGQPYYWKISFPLNLTHKVKMSIYFKNLLEWFLEGYFQVPLTSWYSGYFFLNLAFLLFANLNTLASKLPPYSCLYFYIIHKVGLDTRNCFKICVGYY